MKIDDNGVLAKGDKRGDNRKRQGRKWRQQIATTR